MPKDTEYDDDLYDDEDKVPSRCVLPGYENETEDKQAQELRRIFRSVFSSKEGAIVLNALLMDWYYFELCTTESKKALNEYAKYFIRERLGIVNTFDLSNALITTMNDRGV